MSDYRLGVVSGSPAPDPTTGLCVVTIDGTDVGPIEAICELPEAGWTVWVEMRGTKRSDWVVTGVHVPSSLRASFSRYSWTRTGVGLAAGAYLDVGNPGNTPWSTGSIQAGGGNPFSRIAITRDCFAAIWSSTNGQGSMTLIPIGTAATTTISTQTAGGGNFFQYIHYTGLLLNGETVDIQFRNSTAGLINMTAKSYATFVDARWVVAQT